MLLNVSHSHMTHVEVFSTDAGDVDKDSKDIEDSIDDVAPKRCVSSSSNSGTGADDSHSDKELKVNVKVSHSQTSSIITGGITGGGMKISPLDMVSSSNTTAIDTNNNNNNNDKNTLAIASTYTNTQQPSSCLWDKLLHSVALEKYKTEFADCNMKMSDFISLDESVKYSILKDLNIAVGDRATILASVNEFIAIEELQKPSLPSIWYYFPFVNIPYDVLFDETPTVTQMENTLNLLGIMSALLFSVVFALPMAFDYEVYEGVIERWGVNGTYEHCTWVEDGYDHLNNFNARVITSISTTFLSLLITLLTYILIENGNLDTEKQTKAFWYWSRWLFLAMILLLWYGVVKGLEAIFIMSEWNLPNKYVIEQTCDDVYDVNSEENPWNHNQWVVRMAVFLGAIPAGAFQSLSVRSKEIARYMLYRLTSNLGSCLLLLLLLPL